MQDLLEIQMNTLQFIWLRHSYMYQIEKEFRIQISCHNEKIFIEGNNFYDTQQAKKQIELLLYNYYIMEKYLLQSSQELSSFIRLFKNDDYRQLTKNDKGIWIFTYVSIYRIIQQLKLDFGYQATLDNLDKNIIILWLPLQKSNYFRNQIQNILRNNLLETRAELLKKYIQIIQLEAISIFLILNINQIEIDFQVNIQLIQQNKQQFAICIIGKNTNGLDNTYQIIMSHLNNRDFFQFNYIGGQFTQSIIEQCEKQLQFIYNNVNLYSSEQIHNEINNIDYQYQTDINNNKPDKNLIFIFCNKYQSQKIIEELTLILRKLQSQSLQFKSWNYDFTEQDSLQQNYTRETKENSDKSEESTQNGLSTQEYIKPLKDYKKNQQLEQSQNNKPFYKNNKQYNRNRQYYIKKEEYKNNNNQQQIYEYNNQYNQNNIKNISNIIQREIYYNNTASQQIITYKKIDKNNKRNLLNFEDHFNDYFQQNYNNYQKSIQYSKDFIEIIIDKDSNFNIELLDNFFLCSKYIIIKDTQQTQGWVDVMRDKGIQVNIQNTQCDYYGIIEKVNYDQIISQNQGELLAIEINCFYCEVEQIITQFNNLENCLILAQEQSILEISKSILNNKIVMILCKQQIEFIQQNYNELECLQVKKCKDLLNQTFYFTQIEGINDKMEELQNKLQQFNIEFLNKYLNQQKDIYKNKQFIQIENKKVWKLKIYNNILQFYEKLLNDLIETTLTMDDIQQSNLQIPFYQEIIINIGNLQLKTEEDIIKLDSIFGDCPYTLNDLYNQPKGNCITAFMRGDCGIKDHKDLNSSICLIRGYFQNF